MANFPPEDWDVRPLTDFEELTVPAPRGSPFHLQALLTGKPCTGMRGNFRFLIGGDRHMELNVAVTTIIQDKRFDNMYLACQMELGSQVNNIFKKI
jgi:hypothetical protein